MYALGIDLGTTYTAAAAWRRGRAEMCSLGTRSPVIPSVVLVRPDGTALTGEAAVRRALIEPDRVAREFKRRIGDSIPVLLGGAPFSAETLTAHLLSSVVEGVIGLEGERPSSVVVSHPANWGTFKIDLLRQAVRMADLEVPVAYVTEPEAAAIGYGQQRELSPGQTVAVYDLGGGTFDAAVLQRTEAGFAILGQPEGIERLGGIDVDAAVYAHVAQVVGEPLTSLDEDDPTAVSAVARLRAECTTAKESLSSDVDTVIPVLLPGYSGEVRLTRAELEAMVRPSLYGTIRALKRALRSADVTPDRLSAVLLVGGSSRMPLVAQIVGAELDCPVAVNAHPKHVIAEGAAWLASGAALPVAAPPLAASPAAASPAAASPAAASPAAIAPAAVLPPAEPPASPWQPAASAGPGSNGVRILRPVGDTRHTPPHGAPGPATPAGPDGDEDGRTRRAAMFGGVIGAEAGAAGIAGFEAGRSAAGHSAAGHSAAGHSAAGAVPPASDPGAVGGMMQGPGGPLPAHAYQPANGWQPAPSGSGMTPSQAPQALAPADAGMTPAHAPQPLARPSSPAGPGYNGGPGAGRVASKMSGPSRTAIAGAAAGVAALLVVTAGYFAVTRDRTDSIVTLDAPSASAEAPPSGPTAPSPSTSPAAVPRTAGAGVGGGGVVAGAATTVPGPGPAAPPKGPAAPVTVRVPAVVGAAEADARTRLSGAGLSVGVVTTRTVTDASQNGVVLAQDPSGQSSVAAGSAVNLTVGRTVTTQVVTVPGVVGLNDGEARSRLTGAQLTVGSVTPQTVTNPSQDGVVLAQNPAGSSQVAVGSTVNLTVGDYVPATVPSVLNRRLADARSAIDTAGLTVGSVTSQNVTSRSQDGIVLAQSPAGQSQAPPGSSVDLTVGEYLASVPSVVNQSLSNARSTITAADLTVGDVSYRDVTDRTQDGVVLAQSPAAQTQVAAGSAVDLTVGRLVVPVPSVLAQPLATARSAVTGAELRVGVTYREVTVRSQEGIVLDQSPAAKTLVRPGSLVRLTVGRYVQPVPSLAGMSLADARSRVLAEGFTVGTVTMQSVTSQNQNGIVLDQSPAAQTLVRPGTAVNLTVGRFDPPPTTPTTTTPTTPTSGGIG